MKKIFVIFLGLMLVLNSCNKDAIYGNGQIKTEHRNLTSFSKIDVTGDFDVKIIKAPEYSVQIKSHSNILPFIETEVDGNSIRVSYDAGTNVINARSEITIALPELTGMELVGDVKALTIGNFSGQEIRLLGTGNGRIEFDEGEYSSLECITTGNFVIRAFNTKLLNANVVLHGNGHIQIRVHDELDVTIHGNGKVYYKGDPQIIANINGNGKIIKS
ncbi:MAG: DUF2807 domain-containing protein [Saprospiraceae bacterium]|nr:DUF2807 domain-containing protein [Saprospiraceae bacterium]